MESIDVALFPTGCISCCMRNEDNAECKNIFIALFSVFGQDFFLFYIAENFTV